MSNRIYVYTVLGKDAEPWTRTVGSILVEGSGLLKVGQTTKGSARARIKQQLNTAYPGLHGVSILFDEPARRADGAEFSDHDVHAALVAAGVNRTGGEWFEATLDEVKAAIQVVRSGVPYQPQRTQSFGMRPEQQNAVALTADYFRDRSGSQAPKFLWNAKMRFGKTFTTYQLAKEMGWQRVLVLTFKPAVATAWHDDLVSHVDFDGWRYVDKDSTEAERDDAADYAGPVVWFASLQDLGGRDAAGNIKTKNEVIHLIDWDAIVLDEYHFGAWRDSARELYDPADQKELAGIRDLDDDDGGVTTDDLAEELKVRAAHYLYLSGTPFRAITNGEFTEDAIFNWTYVDEQRAKAGWDDARDPNPYITLPQMQMYSYDMGKDAADYAEDGEFSGFSLNEFFRAKKADDGRFEFERPDEVGEFLEMLRGKLSDQMKLQVLTEDKPPFPFEAVRFKGAIKHSVWYMNNVAACFAMADMLANHPYFSQFEVVVAAGNKAGQGVAALPPVERAIEDVKKGKGIGSITLSVGKLMTGVTVREWGAILMLRSLKSPESYFQAAFRVQSPWAYRDAEGNLDLRKPVCYVFEFDPNRALSLVAEYGSKLATTGDRTPAEAIGELINYLPIFGFNGRRDDPTRRLRRARLGERGCWGCGVGSALELSAPRQRQRAHAVRCARPAGADGGTGERRGLPGPRRQRPAGHHQHQGPEEGQARAEWQADQRTEEDTVGNRSATQGDPREAAEVPRQDPGVHVHHRLPRGSPQARHRVPRPRPVRARHRPHRHRLQDPQRPRPVQRPAPQPRHLPVQAVRVGKPRLRTHR